MKMHRCVFAIFLAVISSQASTLNCTTAVSQVQGIESLTLSAIYAGGWLKNVVAVAKFNRIQTTGRAAQLLPEENYKPRKYIGYLRFDLSRLTEVKKFESFTPGDECQFLVMIPEILRINSSTTEFFNSPVNIHCNQGGGKMILKCVSK